ITGMDEWVATDTTWEPHSHPTHELLWNRRGASSATIGSRTWAIAPSVGLWIPAGVLHSATAPAGTWYRTAHVDVETTAPLPAEPVAVDVTPLLRLLLERLVDEALSARSRELTEQMVFDLLSPSPHPLLVQKPTSALLQPIVTAPAARRRPHARLLGGPAGRERADGHARVPGGDRPELQGLAGRTAVPARGDPARERTAGRGGGAARGLSLGERLRCVVPPDHRADP